METINETANLTQVLDRAEKKLDFSQNQKAKISDNKVFSGLMEKMAGKLNSKEVESDPHTAEELLKMIAEQIQQLLQETGEDQLFSEEKMKQLIDNLVEELDSLEDTGQLETKLHSKAEKGEDIVLFWSEINQLLDTISQNLDSEAAEKLSKQVQQLAVLEEKIIQLEESQEGSLKEVVDRTALSSTDKELLLKIQSYLEDNQVELSNTEGKNLVQLLDDFNLSENSGGQFKDITQQVLHQAQVQESNELDWSGAETVSSLQNELANQVRQLLSEHSAAEIMSDTEINSELKVLGALAEQLEQLNDLTANLSESESNQVIEILEDVAGQLKSNESSVQELNRDLNRVLTFLNNNSSNSRGPSEVNPLQQNNVQDFVDLLESNQQDKGQKVQTVNRGYTGNNSSELLNNTPGNSSELLNLFSDLQKAGTGSSNLGTKDSLLQKYKGLILNQEGQRNSGKEVFNPLKLLQVSPENQSQNQKAALSYQQQMGEEFLELSANNKESSGSEKTTGKILSTFDDLNLNQYRASLETGGNSRQTVDLTSVIEQISESLNQMEQSGPHRIQVQLEPEFLGKVELDLSVQSGELTARFVVDNSRGQDFLEQNIHRLRESLLNQGFEVRQLDVEGKSQDYNSDGNRDNPNFQQRYRQNQDNSDSYFDSREQNFADGNGEYLQREQLSLTEEKWMRLDNYFHRMNLLA